MLQSKFTQPISFFLLIACVLLYNSCRKENKNPSWDVDVLAPLVKSSLTINDIIPDSLVLINPDNSLDIVYKTSLSSFNADSLFKIPDTTVSTTYPLFTTTLFPCSTIISSLNDQTKYGLNGVQLTKAIIRSGKMKVIITNNTDGNISLNYKLPLATLGSAVFDTTFIVSKRSGINPGIYLGTFDLSGYSFDLSGFNGDSYNTIVKTMSIALPCTEPQLNLLNGDYLKVENSFIDIVPEYAKGYFSTSMSTISDTTGFSLFKHIISGSLDLENIDIDFSIENSVGDDARIILNNLSSINTRTNTTIPLVQTSLIGSPININRAVDNNGNVTPTLFQFAINPGNSNIKNFVENLPDSIGYNMDLQINPLGTNVSGSNDFIYYNKLIKTEMNMTIPLSLIANNLTLADTMDFKMDASTDNVNYGNLYLYAENGFPFTAQAQLFLMNDNYSVVDSLISIPNIILAPQLDANFICAGKKSTKLTIPVDETKMELLRSTKKMYLKIKFNTVGKPSYVKIYSFYQIDVKLVADFNYTIGKK